MKKIVSAFLMMLLMTLVFYSPVKAAEKDDSKVTLGEIQNLFLEYEKSKGRDIVPGTEEYYNLIDDQLLNHTDKELINEKNYDLIHSYMVEYVVADEKNYFNHIEDENAKPDNLLMEDSGSSTEEPEAFIPSNEFLSQTIEEIIDRNNSEETILHPQGYTPDWNYSGTYAADYARNHVYTPNSAYPTYKHDCTNFVSQCLVAGGIQMNGTPYHTIIISKRDTNTAYYCGHTFPRKDVDINKNLDDNKDCFYLFDM